MVVERKKEGACAFCLALPSCSCPAARVGVAKAISPRPPKPGYSPEALLGALEFRTHCLALECQRWVRAFPC